MVIDYKVPKGFRNPLWVKNKKKKEVARSSSAKRKSTEHVSL